MSLTTPMTIAQSWAMFRAMSLPVNTPDAQVNEMRKAFYFGATAIISMTAEISSDRVSEQQGMELLSALHNEAREFSAQIVADAALRRSARH